MGLDRPIYLQFVHVLAKRKFGAHSNRSKRDPKKISQCSARVKAEKAANDTWDETRAAVLPSPCDLVFEDEKVALFVGNCRGALNLDHCIENRPIPFEKDLRMLRVHSQA